MRYKLDLEGKKDIIEFNDIEGIAERYSKGMLIQYDNPVIILEEKSVQSKFNEFVEKVLDDVDSGFGLNANQLRIHLKVLIKKHAEGK